MEGPRGVSWRAGRGGPNRVQPDASFASRDAQPAAVVHRVEQLGRGAARAAEPVAHAAVREVRVDVRSLPVPATGDYENDSRAREDFQAWLNALWRHKDDTCVRLGGHRPD